MIFCWLIVCLLFYATQHILLMKGRRNPSVDNVGLCSPPWGGGVIVSLYAPTTVTRDLGLHSLAWRTAPLSRLLRQARRYEDPHGIKTKEGKHTFFVVIWFNKVIIFQPLKVFLLNFHWLIALWDGLTQSERSHNLYYFIDYKFKEVPYMYFKHQLLFAKDL